MRGKKRAGERWRPWELAMLVALGAALTLGTWLSGTQGALAESVVRLHVIANSDSQADQALKLKPPTLTRLGEDILLESEVAD